MDLDGEGAVTMWQYKVFTGGNSNPDVANEVRTRAVEFLNKEKILPGNTIIFESTSGQFGGLLTISVYYNKGTRK